ncbi:MAG: type II toxin-antitoxin system VapC family toxin [Magnetococcales bacterium]|nr:type II toxin-antitoxin system VapC family toxin [Magnetococcales bacterium]MBF0439474.1 type II toxin-antitoxin system VapC family toxin [Magnetococcales bacterium]
MKFKIYIESSIFSYLSARQSRDLVVAAHQQITTEWWHRQRHRFDLYVSELVIQEISAGDPVAATKRLEFLIGIPSLILTEDVMSLAIALLNSQAVPQQAVEDAYHIATATVHGMDFLVTWNCKHIANATLRNRIEQTCRNHDFEPPAILTLEQLLEE